MKVLLDECIDWRFARELPGHEISTVAQMAWQGIRNGELLRRAQESGFEAFITVDRNLSFQQPVQKLNLAVLVMCAGSNRLRDLVPLAPRLRAALPVAARGEAVFISA